RLDVPTHKTDFGITLADWGIPSGPYLVLPFVGPTTFRDVWKIPVDSYADPMWWYAREHELRWSAEYFPEVANLISVRASLLPFDKTIDSAFDPYAFVRDAYLQHRVYMIYHGNPPLAAIEQFQGTTPTEGSNQELEKLLEQQREYEKTHKAGTPAPAASSPPPPQPATPPPSAASVNSPPTASASGE
ncbi:MAG: MlaA family lipoprotein, partial [Rhodanobacteraceae bacterium]